MSVHWLKLSQARGIATVLMYGERRRGTDKPKGYARGKVWLGACRKCSGFNGATHWWNSRTVNEYGYLVDTMAKRRGITFAFPFCILGGFLSFLQVKSAQKKPLPVMCPGLAAWGGRLVIAQICDCVGEASFCGGLQFNNRNTKQAAKQVKTKGGSWGALWPDEAPPYRYRDIKQ